MNPDMEYALSDGDVTAVLGTIYEDVAELQEQVVALQTQVSTLQGQVTSQVDLVENTDLNSLTIGRYVIPTKAVSETLINKPTTSTATGIIYVVDGGSGGQMTMYYIICDKSIVRYYHRAYYLNAWGTWNEVDTSDSGWVALPLATGIGQHNSSSFPARYRKIGKKVRIEGAINGVTAGNSLVATLPSGFRPSCDMYYLGARNGGESDTYSIMSNGQIKLVDSSNDTYNADQYHFINTEFLID